MSAKIKGSFMKKFLMIPVISGLVGFSVLFTMTIIYKFATNFLSGTGYFAVTGADAINSLHGFWIAALAGLTFSLFAGRESGSRSKEYSLYGERN